MSLSCEDLVERARGLRALTCLAGHTDAVFSLAFSPDGRWLASGAEDKTVRLWEVASGREVRRFDGHTNSVNSVAFSPDGRWLASGSWDKTVRLWEVTSGREVRRFEGHSDWVRSVAFSPDGRWLASGSDDNTVRLWEVTSGREVRRLEGHTNWVNSVAFSPDGRRLASGAWDNTVRLWDPQSGQSLGEYTRHTSPVNFIEFSPDSARCASCGGDRNLHAWTPGRDASAWEASGDASIHVSRWSPDGRVLASYEGGATPRLRLWFAADGRPIWQREHAYRDSWWGDRALAFSPDGRLLAGYAQDSLNAIELLDISALECGPRRPRHAAQVSLPDLARIELQAGCLALAHCRPPEALSPERLATWMRGATAAPGGLPLGLAHDLGCRLAGLPAPAARPERLPFGLDTGPYLAFLERLAHHPLLLSLAAWPRRPSDAVIAALIARLTAAVDFPPAFQIPSGTDGIVFLRALADRLRSGAPAPLPTASANLLNPQRLAAIETNLARLDPHEVRFLCQYGAPLGPAPDPRDLLDLLALTQLPPPARAALSQTLRLLPRLAETRIPGGIQAYPIGGYEGLARTGSLDSLLPGELAFDEDDFLHRVLNHEALYYGRERARDARRELAYLVVQSGAGLGGDGAILARALLLALAQTLNRRGYTLRYSFAGQSLSQPRALDRPGEVALALCYQDPGPTDPAATLAGVLEHLRAWRSDFPSRQVLWVMSEHFAADADLAPAWPALRAEAGHQAWFVRVGGPHPNPTPPPAARWLAPWQALCSELIWEGRPAPDLGRPKPVRPRRSLADWQRAAEGIRTVAVLEGHGGDVESVAFSPDGRWLASGSDDRTVRLWEVASGREVRRFEGHTNYVWSVAFSPDGRWLASGAEDATVRLWEVASGREVRRFEGHTDYVMSAAFSADECWLASGANDRTVRLWEVASGDEVRRFEGHMGCVQSAAFSPDGRWLASGSDDRTVRLWEVASGREIHCFAEHTGAVNSVAFSPDSRRLVSGSGDNTVQLWEVLSGRKICRLEGHTDSVWSVAFSPDGRWLASGARDHTVRLWEIASGGEIRRLEGHISWVTSVIFSPDGRWLASGSYDDTVRLWDVSVLREE